MMTAEDHITFDFDLDMPMEPRAAAMTEMDEIHTEMAPSAAEITDVSFHEFDLP